MSNSRTSDVHTALVTAWESNSKLDLSLEQRVRLFEMAINAIEKRACVTLSGVTLLVILDRVLQQSQDKHPILSYIEIEDNSLKIKDHQIKEDKLSELIEGLRFLLIQLLSVLGRITADILTIPLHNELLKVTWNDLEIK